MNQPDMHECQQDLDRKLHDLLARTGDDFQPADVHRERAGIFIVKDDDAIPTW